MVLSCLLTAVVVRDALYLSSFPAVSLLLFLYGLACVSQVLKPNFLTTWFVTVLMSLNITPEPFSPCSGLFPLHGHTNWNSWVDSLTQQQWFELQPEDLKGSRLATKDLIWNSDEPTMKGFSVFCYTDPAHQIPVCLANGSATVKDINFCSCRSTWFSCSAPSWGPPNLPAQWGSSSPFSSDAWASRCW